MKSSVVLIALWLTTHGVAGQSYKPPMVKLENLPLHELRAVQNQAFKTGEMLSYRMHYGMVNAGIATLTVKDSKEKFNGREAYHVVGEGRSLGSFDWFFKVRDKYESYIDKQGLFPYQFVRRCDEGGYLIEQDYTFHQERNAMTNRKKETYMTPEYIQDMLSSFYYARNLNFDNVKQGDIFPITVLVDDEIYTMKIKYMGRETVKVDAGKFRCMKFVPVVQKGRIFKKEEDLMVWITDDLNRIPVLAKAKILVGSIKMELMGYVGTANPVAKVG